MADGAVFGALCPADGALRHGFADLAVDFGAVLVEGLVEILVAGEVDAAADVLFSGANEKRDADAGGAGCQVGVRAGGDFPQADFIPEAGVFDGLFLKDGPEFLVEGILIGLGVLGGFLVLFFGLRCFPEFEVFLRAVKLGHGFKDHVGVLCRHVEEFTAAAVGVAGGVDGSQRGVDFGNHLVHHDVAELLVHPVCGVHPESKGHAGPVE